MANLLSMIDTYIGDEEFIKEILGKMPDDLIMSDGYRWVARKDLRERIYLYPESGVINLRKAIKNQQNKEFLEKYYLAPATTFTSVVEKATNQEIIIIHKYRPTNL